MRHNESFRFAANLLATVFMVLNLNSIMNVIFNVPAAIASTASFCHPKTVGFADLIFPCY